MPRPPIGSTRTHGTQRPAEDSNEFFQPFLKLSFGKSSNVPKEKGNVKNGTIASPEPEPAAPEPARSTAIKEENPNGSPILSATSSDRRRTIEQSTSAISEQQLQVWQCQDCMYPQSRPHNLDSGNPSQFRVMPTIPGPSIRTMSHLMVVFLSNIMRSLTVRKTATAEQTQFVSK
ncbi:hypothetical protein NHQ30_003372 [Ciborinia camelliae]|nr:hypothetical protein NHQ30_003372 [Ciborinia camelliae]